MNITTLFGFIQPANYIPMGGWTIGNEMVFYLFTPAILFIYDKKTIYGNLLLMITCIIGLYFAFFLLNPNDSLANQWSIYVNPFNNLFCFILGIAIFYNFNKIKINKIMNLSLLLISFILFLFYDYKNQIDIVSGWNRIIFVFIITVWIFSFFKMKVEKTSMVSKMFETFGMATYGVYILHPIFRSILLKANELLKLNFPYIAVCIVAVFITILGATISYYYFELKISNWGKKIVKGIIK